MLVEFLCGADGSEIFQLEAVSLDGEVKLIGESYAYQGPGVVHGRLGLDLLHEGILELLGGVGSGGGRGRGGGAGAAEPGRHGVRGDGVVRGT